MKDTNDTSTIDALARGPGRPALYESAAEKQRAYRDRLKARTWSHAEVMDELKDEIKKSVKDIEHNRESEFLQGMLLGKIHAWDRLCYMQAGKEDRAWIEAIKETILP